MSKNEVDIEKNQNIDLSSAYTSFEAITYNTVSEMLSETKSLAPGTSVKVGAFQYMVATASVTNHHLTIASGDKLFVQPSDDGILNALAFNAKGDGIEGIDGIAIAGSVTFISKSVTFDIADVGKIITIGGAGDTRLTHVTAILEFISTTEITLENAPATSNNRAKFAYGTDDTVSLNILFKVAKNGNFSIIRGSIK